MFAACASPAATRQPPSTTDLEELARSELVGHRECYADLWPCLEITDLNGYAEPEPTVDADATSIDACFDAYMSETNGKFGSPGQPPNTPPNTSATGAAKPIKICGSFNKHSSDAAQPWSFLILDKDAVRLNKLESLRSRLCDPIRQCRDGVTEKLKDDFSH